MGKGSSGTVITLGETGRDFWGMTVTSTRLGTSFTVGNPLRVESGDLLEGVGSLLLPVQ